MIIINIYNVKWKRKYTYKEIAKFSGLSDATITKITRGEHVDLKLSTLEKLAVIKKIVKDFSFFLVDLLHFLKSAYFLYPLKGKSRNINCIAGRSVEH